MNKIFELSKPPKFSKHTVIVMGYFDLLHPGHVLFLNKSKRHDESLLVGVLSNKVAKKKNKDRPIVDQEDRLYLISQLETVDHCFISDYYYYSQKGYLLRKLNPHSVVLSCGGESSLEKKAEEEFIINNFPDIKIRYIKRQRYDISTTDIIKKIRNKNVKTRCKRTKKFKGEEEILAYLNSIKKSSNCKLRTSCVIVDQNKMEIAHGVNYHPDYSGKVLHLNKDTHEFKNNKPRPTHAESNAIISYISQGIIDKPVLYSLLLPCAGCAELIKNAGIKRVRYFEDFDNNYGKLILESSGIDVKKVSL